MVLSDSLGVHTRKWVFTKSLQSIRVDYHRYNQSVSRFDGVDISVNLRA